MVGVTSPGSRSSELFCNDAPVSAEVSIQKWFLNRRIESDIRIIDSEDDPMLNDNREDGLP